VIREGQGTEGRKEKGTEKRKGRGREGTEGKKEAFRWSFSYYESITV